MTVSEIINIARKQTGTTTQELDDTTALSYLNVEYPKILNLIYWMDKNYGYQQWNADLINGQNRYSLLEPTSNAFGIQDIEKILVKYNDTDQFYKECMITDFDNFDGDVDYLAKYQPQDDPMAIILDREFLIFPAPKQDVSGGMRIQGNKKPYALTLSSTTSDILIVDQYQDILSYALMIYFYRARKIPADVNQAMAEYKQREIAMLQQIAIKQTSRIKGIRTDAPSLL